MSYHSVGLIASTALLVVAMAGVFRGAGGVRWLGRLPGDIKIKYGKRVTHLPISSVLVLTILLSFAVHVARLLR